MTVPRLSRATFALLALAARAAAQPAAPTPASVPAAEAPPRPAPPLGRVKDDRQIAEAVQSITQDPAIAVDPAARPVAEALLIEGVAQLRARAFEQALANFLEAYARLPSPKLLLDIAATLYDMGRFADAANTYQRYLDDPATGADRAAEVADTLRRLDAQLTFLTVHVSPRGSEVSIDGGPFVQVGGALVSRVPIGSHQVRIRNAERSAELSIHGTEGETKDIAPALPEAGGAPAAAPPSLPERVEGWLITGTQYTTGDATGRGRTVRDHADGHEIAAILPQRDLAEHGEAQAPPEEEIGSGVISSLRIDGKGRGFAFGLGIAYARGALEFDGMVLKSDEYGGYAGVRYHPWLGMLRPYAAFGIPAFLFDHTEVGDQASDLVAQTTTKLAIGMRFAAGLEVRITPHVSVTADLGYEHFFFVDDHFEADLFVPTIGVIGRL